MMGHARFYIYSLTVFVIATGMSNQPGKCNVGNFVKFWTVLEGRAGVPRFHWLAKMLHFEKELQSTMLASKLKKNWKINRTI